MAKPTFGDCMLALLLLLLLSWAWDACETLTSIKHELAGLAAKPAPCRCQRETFRPDLMLRVQTKP